MARKKGTVRPCKWCGCIKQPVGDPNRMLGSHSGGGCKWTCRNPDCPRKGQVPWKLPKCLPIVFVDGPTYSKKSGEFDNAVRALEDRCEQLFFPNESVR